MESAFGAWTFALGGKPLLPSLGLAALDGLVFFGVVDFIVVVTAILNIIAPSGPITAVFIPTVVVILGLPRFLAAFLSTFRNTLDIGQTMTLN